MVAPSRLSKLLVGENRSPSISNARALIGYDRITSVRIWICTEALPSAAKRKFGQAW